jgi:hypothetical protein
MINLFSTVILLSRSIFSLPTEERIEGVLPYIFSVLLLSTTVAVDYLTVFQHDTHSAHHSCAQVIGNNFFILLPHFVKAS